jgi:hypothetical protein
MEKEIQSRVLSLTKKNADIMEENSGVETSMTENDMTD